MMVAPTLFLGRSSLRATAKSPHSPLQIPPGDWSHLLAESLPVFELLKCAAGLLPCPPMSQCFLVSLHLLCLSCLWVCRHRLLQHDVENTIQPRSSESSTCRRKNFALCYHSSFSWASSFKLESLYRTLCSSAQTLFLFCVGNALGMRSRGMFSFLIGKYVFTWIRQAIYLYTLQSCPITTGKIIRTHLFFTGVLLCPHLFFLARFQDTWSVVVSVGSLLLLQVLK